MIYNSKSDQVQGKKQKGINPVSVIIICLIVSILVVYAYDRFFAQKIVTFDLKGFIKEQKELYMKGEIDDAQFKRNVDRVEALLNTVPRNRVVIMGDVVLKGAEKLEDKKNNR